jgi:hypothetical protein
MSMQKSVDVRLEFPGPIAVGPEHPSTQNRVNADDPWPTSSYFCVTSDKSRRILAAYATVRRPPDLVVARFYILNSR